MRIPRIEVNDRPFRYLGRRTVQAMAEAATANLVLGRRSAPGRYLAVRLVDSPAEKEDWEQQFAESRSAIVRELEREARAREIRTRGAVGLDLVVLTREESDGGEAVRLLETLLPPVEAAAACARLREEREVILPRRLRSVMVESDPPSAQVYLDDRPAGVTPCRLEELAAGEYRLTLSHPGYLLAEEKLVVEPAGAGAGTARRVTLVPEPPMGVLEVVTFPPGATVLAGPAGEEPAGEPRLAPARWRLPVGSVEVRVEQAGFEPARLAVELPGNSEERPLRLPVRLRYCGADRDEVVGRLIIYGPGSAERPPEPEPQPQPDPAAARISRFFRQVDGEGEPAGARGGRAPAPSPPVPQRERPEREILGERPLRRGILLIGREDPAGPDLDVRLFDPENSVSRGCHAWLWIYADTSTGAAYNTFLVGNNSPAGIRVDGAPVMESRRLADEAEIEIGSFRLRVVKEVPRPRVEFGF